MRAEPLCHTGAEGAAPIAGCGARRSRANRRVAKRLPKRTRISRAAPSPSATGRVGGITLKAVSDVTATVGRLASTEGCAAVRGSRARVEIAMLTQIDQRAIKGVKRVWASTSGPRMSADATVGWANSSTMAMNTAKTA